MTLPMKTASRLKQTENRMDIVLVSMPFAAPERPSAALGLLNAILKKADINSSVCYANLLYAVDAGFKLYKQATLTRPQDLVGEWLFSDQIFSESPDQARAYVADIHKQSPLLAGLGMDDLYDYLTAVRHKNHEFIDALANKILEQGPKIIGCTSTFFQHMPSLALLQRIKALSPETITILGGANCEGEMGPANHKSFPFLDFVVSGEADDLIVPLVRDILDTEDICSITVPANISAPVHRKIGYLVPGEAIPSCIPDKALNQLPLPDYSDYFNTLSRFEKFKGHIIPSLPVETSRGCWWGRCLFCGLNGRQKSFRSKKAETVLSQVNELSLKYGVTRFQTTDNIMDPAFHNSLIPMLIEPKSPYTLFFETKSDLNKRKLEQMKQAGVIWIQPGIESLDSRVLTLINKGCRAWKNIRMLKFGRQFGIFVGWNFMYGFPGEKDQWYMEMAQILPLLHHLQPSPMMVPLRFDRFSPYFDRPGDFDLTLVPHQRFYQTYRFNDNTALSMAYFFEDRHQQELDKNPILRHLLIGEGLTACKNKVNDWNAAFSSDQPPILAVKRTKKSRIIIDTRSCRQADTHDLSQLEWALLAAMDQGLSHEKLKHGFSSENDLKSSLTHLLDLKLVIKMDGTWLSLAMEHPVPSKSRIQDYPGGLFTWKDSGFSWWRDPDNNTEDNYPWI